MHVYMMHTYINAAQPSKLMFGQIIWSVYRVNIPIIEYNKWP